MSEVPSIDLAPARRGSPPARRHVAAQRDAACRALGFFPSTGHGVPDHIVNDLWEGAHAFFALPAAPQRRVRHLSPGPNRGSHPVGGEARAAANDAAAPPDLQEVFPVGPVEVTEAPY